MDLQEILAALPALQTADRRRVRFALDLLDTTQTEDAPTSTPEAMLWDQIVRVGAERGMVIPPFHRIMKMRTFAAFKVEATRVVAHLEGFLKPADKTELVAFVRLAARALLTRLRAIQNHNGMPITPMTVMRQVPNIPALMDAQWPGGPVELRFVISAVR